jgi:hypothetical protein
MSETLLIERVATACAEGTGGKNGQPILLNAR